MNMHKTTLEQWFLLDRVIELGSFARAAQASHRSQSSVSYNLALLQERLGVVLLEAKGRKAVITPAGALLLAQVRPLLNAFHYVETQALTLRNGIRTRLDLVVDNIFPRGLLFAILREFQRLHPDTHVHLTEILENHPVDVDADVAVFTRREDMMGRGEWLMNIDFVAVAHRDHPLHQQPLILGKAAGENDVLSEETLLRYPQVRIMSRENSMPPASLAATEYWTFSTVESAIEAVLHQVGYGWLPEAWIAASLASGVLKILPLGHGTRRATPLHLIVRKDLVPLDEQVRTLLTLFRHQGRGATGVPSSSPL